MTITIPAISPWIPSDLPTLRAAYSDRTAALMAYLAGFAYDPRIEARPSIPIPAELAQLGFGEITTFHNGMTNGWAYIAESSLLIVLSFRGTQSKQDWDTNFHARLVRPLHTDPNLLVHEGFHSAFLKLSDGQHGISRKSGRFEARPTAGHQFISPGALLAVHWLKSHLLYWGVIKLLLATRSAHHELETRILICGSSRQAIG